MILRFDLMGLKATAVLIFGEKLGEFWLGCSKNEG
jgi:hypothetical protein